MSPTKQHEEFNRILTLLVDAACDELGLDVQSLGSTTFRREDLERGFEPDSCFYFVHAGRVRSQDKVNLSVDPPPELVIEIDIIASSQRPDLRESRSRRSLALRRQRRSHRPTRE